MEGVDDPDLMALWGDVPLSILTLFHCVTGGRDWSDAVWPLRKLSQLWHYIFLVYICFVYFAVLNVVTAIFCHSAIENSRHDPELVVHSFVQTKAKYTQKLIEIFETLDFDHSGGISFPELEKLLQHDKMMAYFDAMDLDVNDAWTLFKMMDSDQTSLLEVDEFVTGCMRLKGFAKNTDLITLLAESRWLRKRLSKFMTYVEGQFGIMGARAGGMQMEDAGQSSLGEAQ
eukprot:gnl/TRDRNA2_/TRDRNA2_175450_c0_seq1.p1 gnl/TRDRNA2_/TRDRNA2_175450_c0~~gnl/TRDRNA2_/TRDRNA2_175450_c0_seq1.p1  ORF type:complete len:229 (-),score=42.16 gnl/TRDRNA2_/TRDRNA2_175450_c0_seq1:168-854(-)